EKFLNGTEPTLAELQATLRKATLAYKLVPVYCGSSLRNKGVQPLLDAVVHYLPSPLDVKDAKIEAPFSALAFKVQTDPHVGRLTYIRVYSGKLSAGSYAYNSTRSQKERVARLLLMHANTREEIPEAFAGEIVAVVGMKITTTGDTLCDESRPIILEGISFTEPVIS
ncbi:elongation factor G, partial [Candidatus Roizmanbacteria bacterium CG17_big_fil_post_rev_8_21_14_2_50_39_7]